MNHNNIRNLKTCVNFTETVTLLKCTQENILCRSEISNPIMRFRIIFLFVVNDYKKY